MKVPAGAEGLIIGSKGSNIKELQSLPGVQYVELRNGKVDIGGTSLSAVQEVQMKIQAKLNSFQTGAAKSKTARLHVDLEGMRVDALQFIPASSCRVAADLSGFRAAREYFLLSAAPAMEGLIARLSVLDVSSQPAEGHSIHAPMDLAELCARFREFLASISDIGHGKVIEVQMRFGVMAFHMLGDVAQRCHTLQCFRALQPHRDFKLQFSCQLTCGLSEIAVRLAREGFELIEKDCCTVVHLVSLAAAGEAYTVVFVESEQGRDGDPRMDVAKQQELDRIARCKTAAEVLGVLPNTSKAALKKSFYKKSLMVHPDKNAYHGATEAMKVLGLALESLEIGGNAALRPPLFEVGEGAKELPRIVQFLTANAHHLQEDVVRTDGGLGFRAAVTSKAGTDKPAAREFLESAWRQGNIVSGGTLQADAHYSIDSVRFKDKSRYSDGNFILELDFVRQKALENAGRFQACPEVALRSPALEKSILAVQAEPTDVAAKTEAVKLYMELIVGARALTSRMSHRP